MSNTVFAYHIYISDTNKNRNINTSDISSLGAGLYSEN